MDINLKNVLMYSCMNADLNSIAEIYRNNLIGLHDRHDRMFLRLNFFFL